MNSPEKQFDVLIIEIFFMYECYLPLAEKLRIPIIGTTSLASFGISDSAIGNPRSIAVHPFETALIGRQMTFYERLKNVFYYTFDLYVDKFILEPKIKDIYTKYYGKMDINRKKISLIFANSHSSIFPRAVVPSNVNIGGIHLEMSVTQKLPNVSISHVSHCMLLYLYYVYIY